MSVMEQRSVADVLRRVSTSGQNLETEVSEQNKLAIKKHQEWKRKWNKAVKMREELDTNGH